VKILVICTVDLTVKVLLAAQIRALEQAGYTVHVACADGPWVPSLMEAGFDMKPMRMVNRVNPFVNLRSLFGLYRLMRREQYAIVHVHTISAAFIGRLAAWLARAPLIIYTFRGVAFYLNSPWWVKPFNLLLERLCRGFTDFYFSQSEENRKRAIKYKMVDPERSLTIGNGVNTHEFINEQACDPDTAARIREELGISPTAAVVGMTARLIREKGVVEFFEAAVKVSRVFPETVFLIVGDAIHSDAEGIGEQLRQMVKQNGLESRFVFTGFRPDATRLYKAMDIFVLPSYHEGMPRSIIEAMASGKPIVATDIPGCQDEVVHEETGLLVPVRDAEALSQAILKLLRDPNLARRMGQAGQKRAIELFDERLVCERIVAAYQRIIEEKFGRGAANYSFTFQEAREETRRAGTL
jgi:glycosyltransferase involved in cell wall biosynthesis